MMLVMVMMVSVRVADYEDVLIALREDDDDDCIEKMRMSISLLSGKRPADEDAWLDVATASLVEGENVGASLGEHQPCCCSTSAS